MSDNHFPETPLAKAERERDEAKAELERTREAINEAVAHFIESDFEKAITDKGVNILTAVLPEHKPDPNIKPPSAYTIDP